MDESKTALQSEILIKNLRDSVQRYIAVEDYATAAYWSNKVVSLTDGLKDDIYIQAKCFFHLKEYHRAAHCLISRCLEKTDLPCRHLAAKCHYAAQDHQKALDVLEFADTCPFYNKTMEIANELDHSECDNKTWRSAIALLRGQIYEALDNRAVAVQCFKEALKLDVYCYDAFYSLVQHQMLTSEEEEQVISHLNFKHQCTKEEAELIKFLYSSQLKKYAKPDDLVIPKPYSVTLKDNVDVMTSLAERYYYNCDYQECFKITSEILSKDLYHKLCLPIHLSCLMELKKTNILFELAHKLVELYPESPISWYAVGCYYLMINKTDSARRYLNKATTLDNVFGPSWLLYGHSFAVESEHDQAMAAYFKASHLMKGCHLPLLYIGLEYGLTDNTKLAEKFFNQASLIAPDDPFVLHELGVIAYQNQEFANAEKHLTAALKLIKLKKDVTCLPQKWEPLLNNLGHVFRKLKKYDEALESHKQALVLSPQNPSTYSAIGYVYSLMCKWSEAVEYFHKALGLKRDDPFSTAMLGHSIEHLMNELTPLQEEQPIYESSKYLNDFLTSTKDENFEESKLKNDESEISNDVEMSIE